jgi:hypothetical protein
MAKKKTVVDRKNVGADVTKGQCIGLAVAGQIVQNAIPGGPFPIDNTLQACGLISDDQRSMFRDHVFDGVQRAGCHVDKADIPNDADTTLREVRTAVKENAN